MRAGDDVLAPLGGDELESRLASVAGIEDEVPVPLAPPIARITEEATRTEAADSPRESCSLHRCDAAALLEVEGMLVEQAA